MSSGVVCQEVEVGNCEEDQFHCYSGECINISGLCDGRIDCKDQSDEDQGRCSMRTEVRLSQKEHYAQDSGVTGVLEVRVTVFLCSFAELSQNPLCRFGIRGSGALSARTTLLLARQLCSAGCWALMGAQVLTMLTTLGRARAHGQLGSI